MKSDQNNNQLYPGNCFSPSFGGSCSGTPQGCRDCNTALKCRRRKEDDDGEYPGLAEYCDISRSHTMCKFSPGSVSERCGDVLTHRVTGQVRQRLLEHHNKLRRVVARGDQPGQPPAANMRQLEWSDELSDISQTWADQCDCVFHPTNVYPCYHEHGGGTDRAGLNTSASGQNLAWQSLPLPSTRQNWTGKAQGWFDEVYDFNATVVDAWEPRLVVSNNKLFKIFISARTSLSVTTHSSCGPSRIRLAVGFLYPRSGPSKSTNILSNITYITIQQDNYKFHYLVCNYYPPGNHVGAPVYIKGPACSACPRGTQCNDGLCQRIIK